MAYFVIEDFRGGLDGRRMAQATPPGSLLKIENAHINRGGEIEKAKAFVSAYTLPSGTFGLAAASGSLYVFGSGTDPGVPSGVLYQQLEHEDGATPAMVELMNWDLFAGRIFATAEYEDGTRRPFYNGTIVAGFLSGSGTVFEGLVISPALITHKDKVYLTSGKNLLFSKSNDPSVFDEAETGSGLIDMSAHVSRETDLTALGIYQNYLAVVSSQNISIWQTDPDPTEYNLVQILPNIGTKSPRSLRSFGDHDVFMVSDSGVRSLRAVNSSLSAGITDVGTPVDDLILATLDGLSAAEIRKIPSEIEPRTGRYVTPLGDVVYVFSFFPSAKISSWSTWNPGFNITDMVVLSGRMYARAGDIVYLAGGANNDQYTDQQVVIELPYLDGRGIATFKHWTALDAVLTGVWTVYVNTNPNDPDEWVKAAVLHESTTEGQKIGLDQYGPVIKFKFVHQGAGPAVLSKLIVHYEKSKVRE